MHTEMSSFQGVGLEDSTVYRGVLNLGGLNRGIPLYSYYDICRE